jgi:hypothetical protein
MSDMNWSEILAYSLFAGVAAIVVVCWIAGRRERNRWDSGFIRPSYTWRATPPVVGSQQDTQ